MNPEKPYQPGEEEMKKAEDSMKAFEWKRDQKGESEMREAVYGKSTEDTLRYYANALRGMGRSPESRSKMGTFSEPLEMIARHVKELEESGFKVEIGNDAGIHFLGKISVSLVHEGNSVVLYDEFFDPPIDSSATVREIEGKIKMAIETAKMFQNSK